MPRRSPPRWSRAAHAALGAAALLLAAAPAARADQASEAQLMDELGRELYGQRRYVEALERFLASNRLVPNANVMANVGSCYRVLGRPVEAFNWYETARVAGLDAEAEAAVSSSMRQLMARVAVVDLRVSPAGAAIYVDRVELGSVGEGSRRYAVAPGPRTLIARADGHHEGRVEVRAARGAVVTVELLLEPILGRVRVESEPPGAVVVQEPEGVTLGETPLELERPPGTFDLRIRAEGFEEVTRRVVVVADEARVVRVELPPSRAGFAVLTVIGEPPGARVQVDGAALGEAPLSLDRVEPGRRRVRIEAPGRDPWSGDVVLEPGSASRVDFRLRDPDGGPGPVPFAVGYSVGGALVAAGLGVGLAARRAEDDFFGEPSRAQLDRVDRLALAADVLLAAGAAALLVTLIADLLTGGDPASEASFTLER